MSARKYLKNIVFVFSRTTVNQTASRNFKIKFKVVRRNNFKDFKQPGKKILQNRNFAPLLGPDVRAVEFSFFLMM